MYENLNVYELEQHLIKFDRWRKILKYYPQDIQGEAEYIIRWEQGLEKHMPHPLGLGYREDIGYFALATEQGPFIMWAEKCNDA